MLQFLRGKAKELEDGFSSLDLDNLHAAEDGRTRSPLRQQQQLQQQQQQQQQQQHVNHDQILDELDQLDVHMTKHGNDSSDAEDDEFDPFLAQVRSPQRAARSPPQKQQQQQQQPQRASDAAPLRSSTFQIETTTVASAPPTHVYNNSNAHQLPAPVAAAGSWAASVFSSAAVRISEGAGTLVAQAQHTADGLISGRLSNQNNTHSNRTTTQAPQISPNRAAAAASDEPQVVRASDLLSARDRQRLAEMSSRNSSNRCSLRKACMARRWYVLGAVSILAVLLTAFWWLSRNLSYEETADVVTIGGQVDEHG